MRLQLGTKIELQRDLSDLQVYKTCQIVRFVDFRDLKKNARRMDRRTDQRTGGRTDPLIEMRGRI